MIEHSYQELTPQLYTPQLEEGSFDNQIQTDYIEETPQTMIEVNPESDQKISHFTY